MTTSALITFTQRRIPDYTRTEILEFYDELQKSVFKSPVGLMRFLDTSTGQDPVLTTVSGTYEYELNVASIGAKIQTITNVYSSQGSAVYYDMYNSSEQAVTAHVKQGISETNCAKITFNSNPGDSTYSVGCYRFPVTLSAPTVEMEIPDHFKLSHMFLGCKGLAEVIEHSKSPLYVDFNKELIPEMQHSFNTEAHILSKRNEGDGF